MNIPFSDKKFPSDFAELRALVIEQGLMRSQPIYFTIKIILTIALLALGIVVLWATDSIWIQLLNGVYMAFVFGQIGLLGHDAGHCQIFKRRFWNIFVIQLCCLCGGVSQTHWVKKHNEHHAHPNHEDLDPDIEIMIIAFTKEQAQKKKGLARFIVRHQSLLFFPILSLVFLSLRIGSVKHFLKTHIYYTWVDVCSFVLHFVLYFTLVFSFLPFWTGIAFIAVHQLCWGLYLGCVFAPNHKGMPVLQEGHELDFVREQVLTSRNVLSHRFVDFWYGGLNYQVEHHLFPNMPRNNLRKASKIVREFCKKKDIPYHYTGLFQSYREILSYLHEVSLTLARPKVG